MSTAAPLDAPPGAPDVPGRAPDAEAPADVPAALGDAGAVDAPVDAGSPPVCTPPAGPYGTAVGDTFQGFELPACNGTPYDFYAGGYCAPGHAASVVIFSALWCGVCQNESMRLDAVITEAYASRGVRVVQVLVDGAVPRTAVTAASCQEWVDTFALSTDVVFDADRAMTSRHYPEASFPVTLVLDEAGVIRYRDVHGSLGLSGVTAVLDGLLPAP